MFAVSGQARTGRNCDHQSARISHWDQQTGEPVDPVVIWQCRGTAPFCEELRVRGLERMLRERTGLTIDPLFSASKARWLLDNIAGGERKLAAIRT